MAQLTFDQRGQLGGHAYRLGHAAISLDFEARRRWELAEPGQPSDEFFGPEEPSSPFPNELGRHVAAIEDASRCLVGALPELTRDQLREALLRAWLVLKGAWLGPSHQKAIVEREEGGDAGDTTASSPMGRREWRDFHLAVHQFCESLPTGARNCAALGAHVAAARGEQPPGHRQEALPDTVSPVPFAALEGLLLKVIEGYPALQGLELDLGEERFAAPSNPPPHSYWGWRLQQVERLDERIGVRLLEIERAAVSLPERWISAKGAELLARDHGLTLPLHKIHKLIKKVPAPIRTRKPETQRLELLLPDLLLYFHDEKSRNRGEAEPRGEDEGQEVEREDVASRKRQIDAERARAGQGPDRR